MIKKRVFSMIMAFALLLAACGKAEEKAAAKEDNQKEATSSFSEKPISDETEQVLYNEKVFPFKGGYTVSAVARIKNTLFVQGSKEGNPLFAFAEYDVDEKGHVNIGSFTQFFLDEPDSIHEKHVYGFTAGLDDEIYVLTGELPAQYISKGELVKNSEYQGRMAVLHYSADGEFIDKIKFDNWENGDIWGILVNDRQQVVLYGQTYISCFKWNESDDIAILHTDGETAVRTGAFLGDTIIFSIADSNEHYYAFSPDSCSLSPVKMNDPEGVMADPFLDTFTKCQGLDGELVLNERTAFWECDSKFNCKELLKWNYSISPDDVSYVCRLSENSFVYTASHENITVIGMAEQAKTERSVVDVTIVNTSGFTADNILKGQNALSGKYTYEITRYSENDVDRLLAEIASGNSPDLVVFDRGIKTESGSFENLFAYIDNDPEISRDIFIPNYLDAISTDGSLYEIWPSVDIHTIAVRSSDISGKQKLLPDTYEQILLESGKYKTMFGNAMEKSSLLPWISVFGASAYIDRASATCSFDDPSFAALLEWCSETDKIGKKNTTAADIDKALLTLEIISSPMRISSISANLGEPFTFVGFPTSYGGVSFFSSGLESRMAIPVNGKNKEGAWEFIKNTILLEQQLNTKFNLPVNIEALRRMSETLIDPDEEIQLFKLLADTKLAENTADTEIRKIIMSAAQGYLDGNKTLEETVSDIQSRVGIYLSEQYG